MWLLPFVPDAYDDEVLGTWQARVQISSGRGAWRVLLERAGVGRKLNTPMFDLIDHSESLSRFFEGLHTDYASAVVQRTTLAYWSALAGHEVRRVPGVPQLPMPSTRLGPVSSLGAIGRLGVGKLLVHQWYCPGCLSLDHEARRMPYLRRTHQLPTVFHCLEHQLALQQGCPACGAGITSGRRDSLPLVEPVCHCGFDLRRSSSKRLRIPEFFERLATISREALQAQAITWNAKALGAWLLDRCGALDSRRLAQMRRLFDQRGLNVQVTRQSIRIPVPDTHHVLHLSPALNTAPAIAALLAAMDVPLGVAALAAARQAGARPSPYETSHPQVSAEAVELTVPDARRQLLERLQAGVPVSQQTRVYWYLRIFDEPWLRSLPQAKLRDSFPSIEEDRRTIQGSGSAARPVAMTRALLRDRQWYEAFKKTKDQASHTTRRLMRFRGRRKELHRALEMLVSRTTRPERITYGALGKLAGLTYLQTMLHAKADPALMRAIKKANDSKIRRQLAWSVRTLAAEGATLRMRAIFARAKLPQTPTTTPYVKQLIATAMRAAA